MAFREKIEKKSYEEWSAETFQDAKAAVDEVIKIARREKLKRLRIGKPFDIEVEVFE